MERHFGGQKVPEKNRLQATRDRLKARGTVFKDLMNISNHTKGLQNISSTHTSPIRVGYSVRGLRGQKEVLIDEPKAGRSCGEIRV